jgi:hypothetical protein
MTTRTWAAFLVTVSATVNLSCTASSSQYSFTLPSPVSAMSAQSLTNEFRFDEWELNDICTHDDSLSYLGFEVTRSFDAQQRKSFVSIKRGKRRLAHMTNLRDAVSIKSSCFGLYSVLGTKRKQLVVVQTSGGAHCCFDYRIYDFRPRLRLIFDGSKLWIGDGFDPLEFQDIDGDGMMEFTQKVMTFDYCCGMSYASSPQPSVVFKYEKRRHLFVVASRGFANFLLRRVTEQRAKAREDPLLNWPYLFTAFAQYIYAGQERTACQIYHSAEGEYLPNRREIRKLLNSDPIYRSIYRGRRRANDYSSRESHRR